MEKSLEQRENERSVDFVANTVKLQGISGQKKGTPTKDLRVGDIIVSNYGFIIFSSCNDCCDVRPLCILKSNNFV